MGFPRDRLESMDLAALDFAMINNEGSINYFNANVGLMVENLALKSMKSKLKMGAISVIQKTSYL